MTVTPTAALVELGGSHDECLYSQAAFLRDGGFAVHVVVSEDLRPRVEEYDNVAAVHSLPVRGGEWGSLRAAWRLWRLVGDIGADLVVFNTAHGAVVRDFTLLPGGGRRLAGVVHNILKLRDSNGQKIISRRIRRYLVLNDYLLDNRDDRLGVELDWFYPIFFPPYEVCPVAKDPGELWACVPGRIDFKRRDYEGFLRALAGRGLPPGLRLLFLGGFEDEATHARVADLVTATGSPERVVFHEGFTDHGTYQSHLAAADLVLPLLHPGTARFHEYSGVQISGAFNLAFAHRTPLLMERSFARYEAFRRNSLFYDLADLPEALARLAADPAPLREAAAAMRGDVRYTFGFQRDRYLRVVAG
jgi:hypothetical protein